MSIVGALARMSAIVSWTSPCEVARFDAVEAPRSARRGDVLLEVGPLARQLVRRDDELLFHRGHQTAEDDADAGVGDRGEEGEPRELSADDTEHHESGRDHGDDGGETNPDEAHVHVGVARADERARRGVQHRRRVDDPELHREEQKEQNEQRTEVARGLRLDRRAPQRQHDRATQRVQRRGRNEREDGQGDQHVEQRS